ncbi:1-acylglycerol-3-phosphate O [Pholiota conissans]|uniref:1-acyl-sn-glycerol-3-phosphate acyltransferase n=1 Tax=Pholiota conissans TaxID=109636 RepID=A0A9P5Z049_9AGAR|nr:1-acylglycerol-3-phosphate O [Pholiota conissans]
MSFLVSIIKPLAYLSLPIILVRQVAISSGVGRYYARVIIYVGTLITVASCSVFMAAGLTLLGRSTDTNYFVARIFYCIISRSLHLNVKVEGEENLQTFPTVLMANHQSMLDLLVIGRLMPKKTAIMAKKSLQFTPLGPFMTLSGTIFIDRGNSARAFRSIDAAGEKMKAERTSLWMFPEGTRHLSKEPDMLSLKKGGFHLALNAGIPITPIVTENYWHLYHKGVFGSGTITVRVLPPVTTTGFTVADVGLLSTRVREQMFTTLVEISPHAAKKTTVTSSSSQSTTSAAAEAESKKSATQASGPLEATAALVAPTFGGPTESLDNELEASTSSVASSVSSSPVVGRRNLGSSEGGETEEDEGMVLVGRPA